jgi:type IV pilus assembly protein PilM
LLLDDNKAKPAMIPNPDYDPSTALPPAMMLSNTIDPKNPPEDFERPMLEVAKLDFIYQIVWQENTLSDRLKAKEEARKEAVHKVEAAPKPRLGLEEADFSEAGDLAVARGNTLAKEAFFT